MYFSTAPVKPLSTSCTRAARLCGLALVVVACCTGLASPAQAFVGPGDTGVAAAASVRGRVLNEEGKPLVGATVFWKGSPFGVTTDSDGNYQLPLAVGHSVVLFSYGGYADDEVSVRGAGVHNVTLLPHETLASPASATVPQKRTYRMFR